MKQHPLDLLPESIRIRSQAGLRTGRYVVAVMSSVALVVLLAVHAQLGLRHAKAELVRATEHADLVRATESRAAELERYLADIEGLLERYRDIASPIETTQVLATLINALPDGVSLDRMDLDAGVRRVVRGPRDKQSAKSDQSPPRLLTIELTGFAPDDTAITEYISRLSEVSAFRRVSPDFTRTRVVREKRAIEFRISFELDLDVAYAFASDVEPVDDISSRANGLDRQLPAVDGRLINGSESR